MKPWYGRHFNSFPPVPGGNHGYWCACERCAVAYAMHYRFDWQGTPADVPAGTVTRNTPRW